MLGLLLVNVIGEEVMGYADRPPPSVPSEEAGEPVGGTKADELGGQVVHHRVEGVELGHVKPNRIASAASPVRPSDQRSIVNASASADTGGPWACT